MSVSGGTLDKVLILAREDVVAALLGLLVELRGLEPRYVDGDEPVRDTIAREHPTFVVLDCDYQDCSEHLLGLIRKSGATPVLFSPSRLPAELDVFARRHGIRSFSLPTDGDTFGRMLTV